MPAGMASPMGSSCSSMMMVASLRSVSRWRAATPARKSANTGGSRGVGPLAVSAFGTQLAFSSQSRKTVEVGQVVLLREAMASSESGVNSRRVKSWSSCGV